jgi:hypothetical protein
VTPFDTDYARELGLSLHHMAFQLGVHAFQRGQYRWKSKHLQRDGLEKNRGIDGTIAAIKGDNPAPKT